MRTGMWFLNPSPECQICENEYRKESSMKLNETPIRTSRNFGINNITLDDIEKGLKVIYKKSYSDTPVMYQ